MAWGRILPVCSSNGISFGGVNGDGTGQTIAIVDAYDDPNAAERPERFLDLLSDLPTFGGSGGPTFTKLNRDRRHEPAGHRSQWPMQR